MPLTLRVAIGLVAGLLVGFAASTSRSLWLAQLPAIFDPLGAVFVNAIRVTVIPIVVSSLIVGVAGGSENARRVGKLGGRALALNLSAMLVAALFAMAVASPLIAHLNVDKSVIARLSESATAQESAHASPPSFAQWFGDLVPPNVFKAAADGAMLPLIIVSLAFGLALTQVAHERRATVVRFFQGISDAFLALVSYVVRFAPIGVFALAVPLAARMGAAAAGALESYVAIVSGSVVALGVLMLYPAATWWGRVPLLRFAKAPAPAQAVAFSSRLGAGVATCGSTRERSTDSA